MNYSIEITEQIEFIDSILNKFNENNIIDNINFKHDAMNWEHYLKLTYQNKDFISFEFIFSTNGFQLNIDRIVEVFDFNLNQFYENKVLINKQIDYIFNCNIEVKYCGKNYTKLFFKDFNGNIVKTLKYVSGLYLKVRCIKKTYPLIYTSSAKST